MQAFTQAPLDCPIYMEIPTGFSIQQGKFTFIGESTKQPDRQNILRLLKNM
jgi:hypothetical protein